MENGSRVVDRVSLQGHQALHQLPGGRALSRVLLQAGCHQRRHLSRGLQRHMQVPQAATAGVGTCEQWGQLSCWWEGSEHTSMGSLTDQAGFDRHSTRPDKTRPAEPLAPGQHAWLRPHAHDGCHECAATHILPAPVQIS